MKLDDAEVLRKPVPAADRMDDDALVSYLEGLENEAESYADQLRQERQLMLSDYDREGYVGDDERAQDGQSIYVTSEVHDAIETLKPDLIDVFFSGDDICAFEARTKQQEEKARQATDGVNYVFRTQNNGFMESLAAIDDALKKALGAMHWHKVSEEKTETIRLEGLTLEMLHMTQQEFDGLKDGKYELIGAKKGRPTVSNVNGLGIVEPTFDVKFRRTWRESAIRIEALDPNRLLVWSKWRSPILERCPYVCVLEDVSVSDLRVMGYDVDAEDMDEDGPYDYSQWIGDRASENDPSQVRGWLRREYVLVDYDGDGIAERRLIHRMGKKVLLNEEFSHTAVSIASPRAIPHQWHGEGIWHDAAGQQQFSSGIMREMSDSFKLANSPRTVTGETQSGESLVNLDDLLSLRVGGVIRARDVGQIREMAHQWIGHDAIPFLDLIKQQGEERTGVSRMSQGMDPDALQATATGKVLDQSAASKRPKLIARVIAECLFVPMVKGILRLLTDGEMPKIMAKIRGQYVEMDPSEWDNQYATTLSVGLGTGDKSRQAAALQNVIVNQQQMLVSPATAVLVNRKGVYNAHAKQAEILGLAQPETFYVDPESPEGKQAAQQQEQQQANQPPIPQVEIAKIDSQDKEADRQAQAAADQRRMQVELAVKQREQAFKALTEKRKQEFDALMEAGRQQHQKEVEMLKGDIQLQRERADAANQITVQTTVAEAKAELEPQEPSNDGTESQASSKSEAHPPR